MTCEAIAETYGLRQCGSQWRGPCPIHGGSGDAFVLREREDGQPLVYCHAGCDFRAIVAELRSHGLWPDASEEDKQRWRERRQAADVDRAQRIVVLAHEASGDIPDRFGRDYRWARKVLANAGYRVRRVRADERRFDGQVVEVEPR